MGYAPGNRIGHYILECKLGSGAFGEVWLGQHLDLPKRDAIKILKLDLHLITKDERRARIARFRQEARTVFTLRHPHIIGVIDCEIDEESGDPYIVMDYAPNGTLAEFAAKDRSPGTVVRYVLQIAEGLQYAHDNGQIHQDVKPGNILLGPDREALLSDFGLAATAQATLRDNRNPTFYPLYAAPERIKGGQALPASDQYSLAVLVYEWLTGSLPFIGADIEAQHVHRPPPPFCDKVPNITPELERVVLRALAKDPSNRFDNVRAFADALEEAWQPRTAEGWLQKGDMLAQSGSYEEAIRAYDAAINCRPGFAQAYYNKGKVLMKLRSYDSARVAFQCAITADSLFVDALNAMGDVLYHLQNFEEAEKTFKRAAKIDPDPQSAQGYISRGYARLQLKLFDEALYDYYHAIQLDPSSAIAHNGQGNAYYEMFLRGVDTRGADTRILALIAYDEAIRLDKQYVSAYANKGHVLRYLENYADSLKAYDQAQELDPSYVDTYIGRGDTLYQAWLLGGTITTYAQQIKSDPLIVLRKAIEAYRDAIRRDPSALAAFNGLGNALSVLSEQEQGPDREATLRAANHAYEEALKINGTFPYVYYNQGLALCKLQRFQEALIKFDKVIQRDARHAYAYHGKGQALYGLKRYKEAITAYEYAIFLLSSNGLTYALKGDALRELKRYDDALKHYEWATLRAPYAPTLAYAYQGQGEILQKKALKIRKFLFLFYLPHARETKKDLLEKAKAAFGKAADYNLNQRTVFEARQKEIQHLLNDLGD